MSTVFRVTLEKLNADATVVDPAADGTELGQIARDDLFRLVGNFLKAKPAADPAVKPAIIARRGENGWRIVVREGQLRVHQSASAFDDFWTVDGVDGLANLPPFRAGTASQPVRRHEGAAPKTKKTAGRVVAEVTALFVLAALLMSIGIWFGTPRRKLGSPPANVATVNTPAEVESVFSQVAGTYTTGKKKGDAMVVITDDGRVTLGTIGSDGKIAPPPRVEEPARAGRRDGKACIITSFGVITAAERDAVDVNNYRWRRASAAPSG